MRLTLGGYKENNMNKAQRIAIGAGLVLVAAAGLFPPWYSTNRWGGYGGSRSYNHYTDAGYRPLFHKKVNENSDHAADRISTTQLGAEYALIIVLTGGVVLLLSDKRA